MKPSDYWPPADEPQNDNKPPRMPWGWIIIIVALACFWCGYFNTLEQPQTQGELQ